VSINIKERTLVVVPQLWEGRFVTRKCEVCASCQLKKKDRRRKKGNEERTCPGAGRQLGDGAVKSTIFGDESVGRGV
jgi:hypothetical protein